MLLGTGHPIKLWSLMGARIVKLWTSKMFNRLTLHTQPLAINIQVTCRFCNQETSHLFSFVNNIHINFSDIFQPPPQAKKKKRKKKRASDSVSESFYGVYKWLIIMIIKMLMMTTSRQNCPSKVKDYFCCLLSL